MRRLNVKNEISSYLPDNLSALLAGIGSIVITILIAFFISGCGKREITEGKVYAKDYEPGRIWLEALAPPSSAAASGKECVLTDDYMYYEDDEDYRIVIAKTDENGIYWNRTLYLDKETYDRVTVGDWFIYDGNNAEAEDRLIKRSATEEEIEKFRSTDTG